MNGYENIKQTAIMRINKGTKKPKKLMIEVEYIENKK